MKNQRLNLIVFTFIFCSQVFNVLAQTHHTKTLLNQLTQQDKLGCTLSAGLPLIITRDTFINKLRQTGFHVYQVKEDYIVIPVKLTNNSNDTLKYIGMSCSWWDIYLTNNSSVDIQAVNQHCYKNGPVVIKLAPNSSSVINVYAACVASASGNFKIGMILQKHIANKSALYLPIPRNDNVIWSNEVLIP